MSLDHMLFNCEPYFRYKTFTVTSNAYKGGAWVFNYDTSKNKMILDDNARMPKGTKFAGIVVMKNVHADTSSTGIVDYGSVADFRQIAYCPSHPELVGKWIYTDATAWQN